MQSLKTQDKSWIPKWIPEAFTFFSSSDVWSSQGIFDERTCERCGDFGVSPLYHGDTLRLEFSYLEIVDIDRIDVMIHPNCRHWLSRV